jgi:hypothetical protein
MNPLFTPEYFSITVLPNILKEKAAEKIIKYGKKLNSETGISMNGWNNIIDFMYSEDKSMLYPNFKDKIKKIDNIRNTNIYLINPELNDD